MKTVKTIFENGESAVFEAEVNAKENGELFMTIPEKENTESCVEPNVYKKSLFDRILSRRDIVTVSVDETVYEVPWYDGMGPCCVGENLRQSGYLDNNTLHVAIIWRYLHWCIAAFIAANTYFLLFHARKVPT